MQNNGVVVTPLKRIKDERGDILHMLRADSDVFSQFGEVYFSFVNPGVVKAWKHHQVMQQNFAVPVGEIKLVTFHDGIYEEYLVGGKDYNLITIPPMTWYGFKGVSREPAMIANCSSIPHDPDEATTKTINDPMFDYVW